MADLGIEIAKKNKEIRRLRAQSKEGLGRIWDSIGNPSDVNKARLFINKVKIEGTIICTEDHQGLGGVWAEDGGDFGGDAEIVA